MSGLTGRVAIVTGGASGIGLGCATQLTAAGASVVIADIALDKAQEAAAGLGPNALAVQHDVSDPASAAALVAATLDRFGQIDILVNNAGVGPKPFPVQDLPVEEFDRVIDINLKGVFLTTRAVVPELLKRPQGRIVNISSVMGQSADVYVMHYVASKHALIGVTRALALELAPHNITVNAVCPGVVETALHARVVSQFAQGAQITEQESWESFRQRIPLGRFQTPAEIGDAVTFLASDQANSITGVQLGVDGGWVMH